MANTDNQDYIVEMRGITKRFPGIIANDNISLNIKKGEIFAILGENGAGKSTLMSILFGMYEPEEGQILINGRREKISSPNYATKLSIGMVHQHFKLVSNYTISENIIMGNEPKRKLGGLLPIVDIKAANLRIAELSRQYRLEVEPTALIEDITVAMQQRVEILKMLYRQAEILIFDEPTAVLTPQEISYLLEILNSLRQGGKTIILISHKLEEIKQVADRCAILRRGKLVDVLDVKQTDTQTMANLMVGRQVQFDTFKPPAMPGEPILQVENLVVKNNLGFDAVNGISFDIKAGEIFAVAGVFGNGQTELADALAGLAPLSGGTIKLDKQDITDAGVRQRIIDGIAYIPEDRQKVGLVLDFDLADNLALKNYYQEPFCQKGILHREHFLSYGQKLIAEYDIRSANDTATKMRSMSGGNQQKAIIAREIELNGRLMIFMQPTRGLDIGAIENIHRQILEQRALGKAILLISLELDEIMALADTIAIIYNGQFVRVDAADQLSMAEVGNYMMGVKQ